jgi:hypothetical protein
MTFSKSLLPAVLMLGCVPRGDVDEVRESLPTASAMQIKLPGGAASQAAPGAPEGIAGHTQALLGEQAQFYTLTRGVSVELNTGAAFVLILVRTIVVFPVTSIEGDTYIWGPWDDALSPSQYRLTVTQNLAGDYEWSLEGRLKAEGASAAYDAVVAGVAAPGQPLRGAGTFSMDFDTAERLDPAGNDAAGVLTVAYDLESEPRGVTMDFRRGLPNEAGIVEDTTAHYEYREAADGSGDFVFAIHGDLDDDGSAWEDMEIRSRWHATGAGRSDVVAVGGDFGGVTLNASECWDTSFGRVFWTDSLEWQPTEGDPADCAFSSAAMP